MDRIELSTGVGRLRDIEAAALEPYDAVYLGDPFCDRGEENLLERPGDLREAIRRVRDLDKRAYLTTYVEPWTAKFPMLEERLAQALAAGAEAVEVFDLGVLRVVVRAVPRLAVHLGAFLRLFNPASVQAVPTPPVARLIPNPELSLEEIDQLRAAIPIELQVHGKLALGYTERCALKPAQVDGQPCRGDCYEPYRLVHESGLAMRPAGRVTLGQKDLCLLPHLGVLLQKGYRFFRIETRFETPAYRQRAGRIYREQLTRLTEDALVLRTLSPDGLCNGFYFSRPGLQYVA